MKMTRFMKTVLMKSAFLYTKWAAHFDFTPPKGLKITPSDQEKVEEYKMENKRVRKKKTDVPLNFYIVSSARKNAWPGWNFH
jgi:hypothetical protein